jgi:hypothetical protein
VDKVALVSFDIERGSETLAALENGGFAIRVALWLYSSEYGDWRLVISSPQLSDPSPKEAYRLLNDTLGAAGFGVEELPPILILPMSDPFVRELRKVFGKSKSVEGMRLGGQTIGDRFVEEAYVYRIS